MPPVVVETRGVGKRYALGGSAHGTLRDALSARLSRGRAPAAADGIIWALRDVDLTVRQGEVVGIVGRNGAGKSTLLKIVARITEPTTGMSRTRGRLSALLEVGTGFHGELTGRENVFVNGAILGMSRRDVAARLDEIVAFAGVERFIDTPLKRYSTGMQLRLAFSVAAHIEPEIVVVDEVLAVGDYEFQQRCLGKMSEMARAGRTVLFVTHDQGAMARLCSRAVWLEGGRVHADGATESVLESYLRGTQGTDAASVDLARRAAGPLRLVSARVEPAEAAGGERRLVRSAPLVLEVTLEMLEPVPGLDVGLYIQAEDGMTVLSEGWADSHEATAIGREPGTFRLALELPPLFRSGTFTLALWLGTQYDTFFNDRVLTFDLEPRVDDKAEQIRRDRLLQPPVRWTLERLAEARP